MNLVPASQPVPDTAKVQVSLQNQGSGTVFCVPSDKTAGQKGCPTPSSLKGVVRVNLNPAPTPPSGSASHGTHLRIVATDDHEPTDEDLWLEDIARQVEADARPLFAMALAYLFRRALELDEDEPA